MATRHFFQIPKSPKMKSIREIFKTNPSLLSTPEVVELFEYCEQLQDEIMYKNNSKKIIFEETAS